MTSSIEEFYSGTTILITGGTGFLGKLIVEKLLRTCRNIDKIYLILRDKNGQSVEERMESYFKEEVFSRVKKENPRYREKVSYIRGDIELPNLNICEEDTEKLVRTVNIIFHAAATVNFHQKLRKAVDINVHGIKRVMELSKKMYNLKALIHISTVYSNCHLKKIEEKIYDYHVSYEEIVKLMETCTDEQLEKISGNLMGDGPNTYTFTKALAERYVMNNSQNLPIAIFRPAIVISTAKEPFAGWIDNFYGPTGLLASALFGFLHVIDGDPNVFSNIVPADLVINCIIASAWDVANYNRIKLPVYNFVSTQNPLTWGEYINMSKLGLNYPFSKSIWYMSLIMTKYRITYELYRLVLHFIPAFIVDLILVVLRKKPHFLKRYKKIHQYVHVLSFFAKTDWEFTNDNVLKLWNKLNEADKNLFNFDVAAINWHEYFQQYVKGIRIYLCKDDLSTVEAARIKYQRLFWVHQIFKYSGFLFLLYLLW